MASRDLTEQQRQQIQAEVESCYLKAERYFKKVFERPLLSYRRSGKNAGTAFLQQNRINIHPLLFSENQEEFIHDVIPHEVSHLLVWNLFGRTKPHGREWQSIMLEVFNRSPSTTHSFDTKGVVNTVAYRCNCSEHAISLRRHKNVLSGKAQYRCRKCSGELVAV
ncbi:SprT family zinc-dependent metalloprotease [Alteromonas sp. RW2A1]|uniref:SprT family zinc-dependent metalloprotease n=1 Tax=Alteromonas sp. RW2A1 TaxID=1917158 RepID=UPI0009034AA2|nr:SprT family zinc-dependent metalloprotease [Alteromonas sp. RW2A1]